MRKIIIIALAALCAVGCGKSQEERSAEAVMEAATGHDVDIDEDGEVVSFKTDDGQTIRMASGGSAELPDSFPDDIYLPDDYTVTTVMEMGEGSMVLELAVDDEIATLFDAAGQAMQEDGWEQTMTMQQSGMHMLGFEKGERSAMLSFYDEGEDGTRLAMQLTAPQ